MNKKNKLKLFKQIAEISAVCFNPKICSNKELLIFKCKEVPHKELQLLLLFGVIYTWQFKSSVEDNSQSL